MTEYDPKYLAANALLLTKQNDRLRTVLGDLIDALSDEVRYEVGQSPHVIEHIDRACALLGGPYEGYIGEWA